MSDAWRVTEMTFDRAQQPVSEALFTLSNGYLGTRGAFEEGYPGDRPATFIHGVYDDVAIGHTELANAPDWLSFDLLVDGERFRLDRGEVLEYRRELHLGRGLLARTVRWRSPAGRTVSIAVGRFASLADPHLCAIRYVVVPVDFDGLVEWRAGLDAHVENGGAVHWSVLGQGECDGLVWLHSRTRSTGIQVGQAARLAVAGAGGAVEYAHQDCDGQPQLVARARARRGQTLVAEKVASVDFIVTAAAVSTCAPLEVPK